MEKFDEWKGKAPQDITAGDLELLIKNAQSISAKFNEYQKLMDDLTAKRNELKNLDLS